MTSEATVSLTLIVPYCQSRFHSVPKLNKELSDAYEQRTWRERLHTNIDGEIIVPGMALQNCIKEAAKYLSISIPGKGKSTYTKHFESGVSVLEDISTGLAKDQAKPNNVFVPSNGIRGAGSRVRKTYPMLMAPLTLQATVLITDDVITADVFTDVLTQAGNLIGIGAFRVRNQGNFGRFKVDKVVWKTFPGLTPEDRAKLIEYAE